MLTKPEYDWETKIFWVNEGPAILHRNGKYFLTYSASATDENYAMGMLTIDEDADLLDARNWAKSPTPGFPKQFGHSTIRSGTQFLHRGRRR